MTNNPASSHPYRGFVVLNGKSEEVRRLEPNERPVWFVFNGMGSQWSGMGRDMMRVPSFKETIYSLAEVLRPHGLDLVEILNGDPTQSTLKTFVSIAAIQVALVDCLKRLGIKPDGIVGHSVGELGCSYADECFTGAETVLAAYYRGKCVEEAKLEKGAMAAVGLTWAECLRRCPAGIVPACHNAKETVTISGEKEKVIEFVNQIQSEGIFAKLVDSAEVAFHSPFMKKIAPALKSALDKVIVDPKPRSSKWLSTSIPESEWNSQLAQTSSPEYHVNNLCSPVLFQEAIRLIPENALIIEIGPHSLLAAVLKRSLPNTVSIFSLMKKDANVLEHFYSQLGRMYTNGLNLNPVKLLISQSDEKEIFPLPGETRFLSPLVSWNHSTKWNTPKHTDFMYTESKNFSEYSVDLNNEPYLAGHKIDGRVLYPATGYLCLVWKSFSQSFGLDLVPVEFSNVEIHRATILNEAQIVKFRVSIAPITGEFELSENGALIVSGRVKKNEQNIGEQNVQFPTDLKKTEILQKSEVYKSLRLRGYEYSGEFRPIVKTDLNGEKAELEWTGNWVPFLDGLLQMNVLGEARGLLLPTRIRQVSIDPKMFNNEAKTISAKFDPFINLTECSGVRINGLHASNAQRRANSQLVVLEKMKFISYDEEVKDFDEINEEIEETAKNLYQKMNSADFKHTSSPKTELGQILKKATELESNKETFMFECQKLFLEDFSFWRAMAKDLSLMSGRNIKLMLDTVLENLPRNSSLKVLEVSNSVGSSLAQEIIRASNTHPQLSNLEYHLACAQINEDYLAELNASLPFSINALSWDVRKLPNVNGLDLLVINIEPDKNGVEWLKSLSEQVLRSDAFLIVHQNYKRQNLSMIEESFLKIKRSECNEGKWSEIINQLPLVSLSKKTSKNHNIQLLRRQTKHEVSSF